MKITLELENNGDNLMLGVPKEVKRLEGKVTAVIIRKEVVPVLPEVKLYNNLNSPYVNKAYIDLEIDGLRNVDTQEKTVPQIEWAKPQIGFGG